MVDDWGFCLFLNTQSIGMLNIFHSRKIILENQGLRIDSYDLSRPWGGFFVLDENQAQAFADIYFQGLIRGNYASLDY